MKLPPVADGMPIGWQGGNSPSLDLVIDRHLDGHGDDQRSNEEDGTGGGEPKRG